MLPRAHRLTRGADISLVIRNGQRRRLPHAVLHLWINVENPGVRAAFVVGKPVGNSVVRSTVSRRLRHGFAPLISSAPDGAMIVVRAFEGSDQLSAAQWTQEMAAALASLVRGTDVGGTAAPEDPTAANVDTEVDA